MNTPDIIEPITKHSEWLFKKMAGRFEGWAIKSDIGSSDVPLNDLDYFAIRVLAQTVDHSNKTVLAVPRITPGLSLSLVSYLTINRFISKEKKGTEAIALMFDGFKAIQMAEETPVIVVTKNRKLRDYYLSSDITFSGHSFPFKNFPIYRIKRSGELTPLSASSDDSRFKIAPVVFYHLDQLEEIPKSLEGSVVLVELDTLTGFGVLKRLQEFMEEINPSGVLAVTSTFSTSTLIQLKSSGFDLILLRPENALRYSGDQESFPSFSSAMANIPSLTEIHTEVVNSKSVEILLSRLSDHLNIISSTLGNELPSIFFAARTIHALLKNLSVPLELLESERKQSGYLKSIKYLLERIFTNRYMDLTPAQESVILPVWGAMATDFFDLYNQLLADNPKYTALKKRLLTGEFTDGDVVVVYDEIQAKILKDVVFNSEVKPELSIVTAKEISRKGLRATRLISAGLWQSKDEASVLSAFPEDIDIICYSIEGLALKNAIKRLQDIPLAPESSKVLENLGLNVSSGEASNTRPWIMADEDTEQFMNAKQTLSIEETEEEQLPDFYYNDVDDLVAVDGGEDDDEVRSFFDITSDEGESYKLDASKDVLAYSESSKTVKSISPENLAEGDSLLALDDESNKEIFQEVASRTKDLSGADSEVLYEWDRVLSRIRKIKQSDGERSLIDMLHLLKCKKTETTMRQWFKGVTLAPQDEEDIVSLLRIANVQPAQELAPSISVEIDKVRRFHRRLGKRLHKKMGQVVRGDDIRASDDIDIEIDEILDLTHMVKVDHIEGPTTSPLANKELLVLR